MPMYHTGCVHTQRCWRIGITPLILIGQSEEATETAVADMGTDGRLLRDVNGNVIHVTMVEKLLVLLLAKLTNLVPEGGIWMNTQRPEWNDANNALVGKGTVGGHGRLSAPLYRFLA